MLILLNLGEQDLDNDATHFFILGEPKIFTYYSIADGNWTDTLTWSTAGYLSTEAALRPPGSNDNIRIGNGKTITLNNSNHSVGSGRTVIVETGGEGFPNGHLDFDNDDRYLQGQGTFILDSGAAITIRHSQGIYNYSWSYRNYGCIRTSTREYNYNNHNSGHFKYGRLTTGTQSVGNGLPYYMQTFTCEQSSSTQQLTFPAYNLYHISDSIHIIQGNIIFSTINTKIGGNFIVELNGQYDFGTSILNASYTGNPSTGQQDSSSARPGGLMFTGTGIQYIWVKRADTTAQITINRLSLVKPSGKVISRNNINASQLFFHEANRANYNCSDYNKWIWGSINVLRLGGFTGSDATDPGWLYLSDPLYGYVEGRLLRSVATNGNESKRNRKQFPIGTNVKYAPMDIETQYLQTSGNGLVEVQAVEGNHPNFNPSNINPNTNIQRYYEITLPNNPASTMVIGNSTNLVFRARAIFTQDEPRGGIDPLDYDAFRLRSTLAWTNTLNIETINNTSTEFYFNLNTAPRQSGNNIFEVTSLFSSAPSITIMIGEAGAGTPERIFYSRNSGSWTNPNTWSYSSTLYENTETGYALDENSVNDYPRYSNTSFRDYAIIGAGDSVYCDTTNFYLAYALLEKSSSGVGKLVMPGENNFTTEQYVQKNGGKLFIGSASGITSPAIAGNILRRYTNSIINYDWNNLGVNNFAYIGGSTDAVQSTGSGLPNNIASLTINYSRTVANRYVDLTNNSNLIIQDSLIILNGRLRNRDENRNITICGNLSNYSSDVGFHNGTNPSNRAVIFDSTFNQQIKGTASLTLFPDTLRINKASGNVTAIQNIQLNSVVDIQSNTCFNLSDNYILTYEKTQIY